MQGSKPIREKEAIDLLNENFKENITDKLYIFPNDSDLEDSTDNNLDEAVDEEKLDILGTFQTIRFKNETDPIRGLEPLVTEYFYMLFQCFKENNSILISNNRLFSTVGMKNDNKDNIVGIKGIPDALLITEYEPKYNLFENCK